jgi:hypothetical protein
MSAGPTPRFRSVIATWGAVLLLLAGLDWILFRQGLLWRAQPSFGVGLLAGNWTLLWTAAKTIETPDATPRAFIVGSSVVFSNVEEYAVNDTLAGGGVPARLSRLTTLGGSATDSALLAWRSLDAEPFLVVYAGAPRDFPRTANTDTPTARIFADASVRLPALPRPTLEAELDAWVRRVWRLYRYRFFVRAVLDGGVARLAGALAPRAAGATPPAAPPAPIPPDSYAWFVPGSITAPAWARWTRWRETGAFEDYKAWLVGNSPGILDVYREMTLANYGPDDGNPQVASFRWIARAARERGARLLVVYTPENPLFRRPEAAPWFDAALSDGYAALFAEEAARVGGRFVDLRNAVPAEEFADLVHLNLRGVRTMSARVAALVDEEWRAHVASPAR